MPNGLPRKEKSTTSWKYVVPEIGERIMSLTFLGDPVVYVKPSGVRQKKYKFLCHCWNEFRTTIQNIYTGHTKSCGCLHKQNLVDRSKKHGFAARGKKTREYIIWVHMRARCYNPKYKNYHVWGGRGITVCDSWLCEEGFINFLADMGPSPSRFHSIDRIDNSKGYSKENCRWATQTEQMRNVRKNRVIEYNGESRVLSEWAEVLLFEKSRYYYYKKKGLSDIEILDKLKTVTNA